MPKDFAPPKVKRSLADPLDPNVSRAVVTGDQQTTETVTNPPPDPNAPPPEPTGKKVWYYCLGAVHGGAPLGSEDRIFESPGDGCPICPVCVDAKGNHIQVNAILTEKGVVPNLEPRVTTPGLGG